MSPAAFADAEDRRILRHVRWLCCAYWLLLGGCWAAQVGCVS